MMKTLLFSLLILMVITAGAQNRPDSVYLAPGSTLHFISPEPIQYVDISSKSLVGNIPLKNVFSLKLKDSAALFFDAIVTIAGEKFIAQYRVLPGDETSDTEVTISPAACKPLDIAGIGFSQNQLKQLALALFSKKPENRIEKVKAFGMENRLNHIYAAGDYLFLDISCRNKTRLKYDVDDFRFKLDDKKVNKASNVQSLELKPEFVLFNVPAFTKHYRNIFVLKKMTFPGNKVLRAELSERQISGRIITLDISYQDVLDADILPLD
jgi:conjugative transposon TraN protein